MHSRSGFTLIEMLLATVLTSVLMVGVLAVITRVSRPISTPISDVSLTSISIDMDATIYVLYADLAQADEIEFEDDMLSLKGNCGLDPVTKERTQRPVRVRYRIHTLAGESWLVREERLLDVEDPQVVSIELVSPGISRVALEPPAIVPAVESNEADAKLPVEGRWRLRLWSEGDQQVVDRSIILRRSLVQ